MTAAETPGTAGRRVLLLTGAGTSIDAGFLKTEELTRRIEARVFADRFAQQMGAVELLRALWQNLSGLLVRPGIVTFEHVYQAILDAAVVLAPPSPEAFDEFKPVVLATHTVLDSLRNHSAAAVRALETSYYDSLLDEILDVALKHAPPASQGAALRRLADLGTIWSFTLNYDGLLRSSFPQAETGFLPGPEPRVFDAHRLRRAIPEGRGLHCHLHGSLFWGRPTGARMNGRDLDVFAIHEYGSAEEGVKHAKSLPSGRPLPNGQRLPPGTLITGLTKADAVLKQPFFSYFQSFYATLDLCTDLVIAGYGLRDYHVNEGIRAAIHRRPELRLYFVDWDKHDDPTRHFDVETDPPEIYQLLAFYSDRTRRIRRCGNGGWWRLPEADYGSRQYPASFVWLKGWSAFCDYVSANSLP